MSKVISVQVNYKGEIYWIEDPDDKSKVFAYKDKELTQLVKINGKTLMFKTKELEDKLFITDIHYESKIAQKDS